MTALAFIATWREARVLSVGMIDGIAWAQMFANGDGTEDQFVVVLERDGEARFLMNPSSAIVYRGDWKAHWDTAIVAEKCE